MRQRKRADLKADIGAAGIVNYMCSNFNIREGLQPGKGAFYHDFCSYWPLIG